MLDRAVANFRQAFTNEDFARFTAGNGVSLVGMWAFRIGVGWLAWELTHSAFWVGLVAFVDLFPTLLVTPIAGAVADRRSRLAIVRVTQFISIALVGSLTLLTVTGALTIELLALVVLLNGLTMGFKQPSRMALTRSLVRPADLPSAIAINAIVFNLARFIGPALAGLLIVSVGVEAVFVFDALSSLFFLAVIRSVHLPQPPPPKGRRTGIMRDIVEGVRYAAAHPGLGPILLLMLILGVCMRSYVELLPAYSAQVLDRGADGLAILSAGIGLGAILAAMWLMQRAGGALGLTRIVVGGHACSALSLIGLALAPNLPVALVCVISSGIAVAAAGVASQTLTQRVVDEAMLGRVMSLYGVIFRAGPAAGALGAGLAGDLDGLGTPWLVGGTISLLATVCLGRRLVGSRRILEEEPAALARAAD